MANEETAIEEVTLEELQEQFTLQQTIFEERIAELELELEDRGWISMSGAVEQEFSRAGLRIIAKESRLFYMKNPLVRRAAQTLTNYCFGLGITIKADHPLVDVVVQKFMHDPKNKTELTTVLAMETTDADLQIDGNLFFVFFTNGDGDTRIRTLPYTEIEEIITNPEDGKEPWFYWRSRQKDNLPADELYPDWRYQPSSKPAKYKDKTILWDKPVYHVKVNVLSGQRFGLSELYSVQDWARAYNTFLSDWSTIVHSLARFAWKITKKKGRPKTLLAAKKKLDSEISNGSYQPAPATGSVFLEDPDTNLSPIKTSGATTSAQDGRRLLLMVCAGTGIFEPYMGDPSTGNLATAKAMDRPMELMFLNRERLWQEIWENILTFVVEAKARAGQDGLSGSAELDGWQEQVFIYSDDVDNEDPNLRDKPLNTHVSVDFPDLVERDVETRVKAIISAATLDGNPLAGTLNLKFVAKQLLLALGETSVEEVLAELFPEGAEEPEIQGVRETVVKLRKTAEAILEASGGQISAKR